MKLTRKVLFVLLLSIILLTDCVGSIFAGRATDRNIVVRHVFVEDTGLGKGLDRYAAECFKVLGFGERTYTKYLEDCSYVSRPISENSVPTAADGLINPDDPVKLYAFKDKVSFGFSVDGEWDGDFQIRVFDDSGKLVGTFSGAEVNYNKDEKGLDIYPSRDARNYYVEFSYDKAIQGRFFEGLSTAPKAAFGLSFGLPIPHLPSPRITIPDGSTGSKKSSKSKSSSSSRKSSNSKASAEDRAYCYILFSLSTFEPDLLPEEVKEADDALRKYTKEHNISSYAEMSTHDVWEALHQYFWEKQIHFFNVSDWRESFARMSMSELDKRSMKYLTKNRISSIESMTDAQIIALRASMIEGDFAGRPEYSRIVKDYKAKYGIKSYEDMTINDLNRLEHFLAKQATAISEKYRKQQMQTQSKPSGSKAKKKKSR